MLPFSRPLKLAVSLALGLALSGCVHDPTVQLNHAELNGIQVAAFPPKLGVLLTVVVDITNPNSFDVGLRGMRGQVILADKYPLPMMFQPSAPGLWLRAGQATSVRVPVEMPIELAGDPVSRRGPGGRHRLIDVQGRPR